MQGDTDRRCPFAYGAVPWPVRPTRPVTAPPVRSPLAHVLSLALLAGLASCGPATSDHAPSLVQSASVEGPSISQESPSARHNGLTPEPTPPIPTARSASGLGAERHKEMAVPSSESEHLIDGLVVPVGRPDDPDSPDARSRLRSLESSAQAASAIPVDTLIRALEDTDAHVRARAKELIEQAWAQMPEAEK